MKTKMKRIEALDGLRGIASLIVLVHHSFLVIPDLARPFYDERSTTYSWMVYTPAHIVWAGTEAVFIFFILSGIVLALPVLQHRNYNWRAYYPSRMARLYFPVLALVGSPLAVQRLCDS